MGRIIDRRRVMGKESPYDAKIEYLESTGTQWIDTGVIVSTPYSINGKFLAAGEQLPNNAYIFFGAGIDYRSSNIECYTGIKLNQLSVLHGSVKEFSFLYNTVPFTVHYKNKDFTVTNGEDTYQYLFINAPFTTPYTMAVLASHRNRILFNRNHSRCYWFEIKDDNDITLVDLIPVRIGTTGYMYDKVSKQLFGNSGTGEFILGPDVT